MGAARPGSYPSKAWTFDPQAGDFSLESLKKEVNFRGPLEKLEKFHSPRMFGNLTPPLLPVSNYIHSLCACLRALFDFE